MCGKGRDRQAAGTLTKPPADAARPPPHPAPVHTPSGTFHFWFIIADVRHIHVDPQWVTFVRGSLCHVTQPAMGPRTSSSRKPYFCPRADTQCAAAPRSRPATAFQRRRDVSTRGRSSQQTSREFRLLGGRNQSKFDYKLIERLQAQLFIL